MRAEAYRWFAIVAWPAAVWGVAEMGLRLAAGERSGLGGALVLTVTASATILACTWRRRELLP